MKKVISLFLLMLLLLSNMTIIITAQETEQESNEITNISPLGTAYCTSEKNSLWTPAKSLIDGLYGTQDWHGWECAYPEVAVGQDTSAGFSGEFCGIKFENDYYEISQIKMNIGLHTLCGGQNATYTIQALVDGKWQDIAVLKDEQAVPTSSKYADFDAVMADPEASHRVNADLNVTLSAPVTTNNVRVVISNYAKNYEGGDVLIFPFIYELELFGKKGVAPEIILPEGAEISTDVAWHAYPNAVQGSNGTYPFLAIDGNDDTYWEVENFKGGEYFTVLFDDEYEIGSVYMVLERPSDKQIQSTVLEYYMDGTWQAVENSNPRLRSAKEGYYALEYEFAATPARGIRVKFRRDCESLKLSTLEAHLKDSKTYAFDNRFSQAQIDSASNGNIAIIGKPYSSTSFDPYSADSYINDGLNEGSKVWFTGNINIPEHCGITFDYSQKINKAIVSVRPSSIAGRESMKIEIQALVNGSYVTIAQGRSYDGDYKTEYIFNEVETTDIRVVILEASGAIPNVMELELYSSSIIPMFDGIEPKETEPAPPPTEDVQDQPNNEDKDDEVTPLHLIPMIVAVLISIIAIIIAVNNRKKSSNIEQKEETQEALPQKTEKKVYLTVEKAEGKRYFLKKR